jgi:26S proteasome regulatory subunit N5
MLIKRRGQAKQAIVDMVQLCVTKFLPALPSREETFNMLTVLRECTDGKMILEREYSQCTKQLVEMYEADGKIDEACKLIQEIQIETYGSLKNKEKVDFILYQMKLVLMR